jgi:16S rRNA (adenine1518-N6/adenine1519-N6)-dimethyltransferase
MRAKKSYGQHFLTNEHYARRIAQSLQLTDTYAQRVLEVGPGRGMLTKHLIEAGYDLWAAEADPDMVDYLRQHYPALGERILAGDFLRLDFAAHLPGPFGLIGNFPYNISSQILIKMVDHYALIPEMVGMFQKEVADRVAAGPGSKTYGVIGVLVQAFYEVELLFGVSKGNFNPPPKVQSAVIRCTRRAQPLVTAEEYPWFRRVVKTAFGMRRKMLRNSLKPLVPAGADLLAAKGFSRRPERIAVAEFVALAEQLRQINEES